MFKSELSPLIKEIEKIDDDKKIEKEELSTLKEAYNDYEKENDRINTEVLVELYEFVSNMDIDNEHYDEQKKLLLFIDKKFKLCLPAIFSEIEDQWIIKKPYSYKDIHDIYRLFGTRKMYKVWPTQTLSINFNSSFESEKFRNYYEIIKTIPNNWIFNLKSLLVSYANRLDLYWDDMWKFKKYTDSFSIFLKKNPEFLYDWDRSYETIYFDDYISVPNFPEVSDFLNGQDQLLKIKLGECYFPFNAKMIDFQRGIAKYMTNNNINSPKKNENKKWEKIIVWYELEINEFINQEENFDQVYIFTEKKWNSIYQTWQDQKELLINHFVGNKVTNFEDEEWKADKYLNIILDRLEEIKQLKNDWEETKIYIDFELHWSWISLWCFSNKHIKKLLEHPEITINIHSCYGWTNFIDDEVFTSEWNIWYSADKKFSWLWWYDWADWSERTAFKQLWYGKRINKKNFDINFLNFLCENYIIKETDIWQFFCSVGAWFMDTFSKSYKKLFLNEINDKWYQKQWDKFNEEVVAKENKNVYRWDLNQDWKVTIYEARVYSMIFYKKSEQNTYHGWQRLTENWSLDDWSVNT